MVTQLATVGAVAQHRLGVVRELASPPRLLGLLGVILVAVGGAGIAGAASAAATAPSAAVVSATQGMAVAAADRVSGWIGQVGRELDDYAAAIVDDSSAGPDQLAASFRTFLTGTGDYSLLELADLSGQVIAASSGAGIAVAGARWLPGLSATPMVTPVALSGGSLEWLVARLATTGQYTGVLVGALDATQVANLLTSAATGTPASAEIQAVLSGGTLLYSTSMTTTQHAGVTAASMIADGALVTRVSSPAVTAALAGRSGDTSHTAGGVTTVAGYSSVSLPGWMIGIVALERSDAPAAPPWQLGGGWPLPLLAALVGLALLLLAAGRGTGDRAGVAGRLRASGLALGALMPPAVRGGAGPQGSIAAAPDADSPETETAVARRDLSPPLRRRHGRHLRGRYEILEVIGRGGEGQVLRAVDHLHERQVAIKVRRLDPGDEVRRREILNEASVLLRMAPDPHASVLREDFILGDRYYLVMDWIEGTPLDRLVAEGGDPGLPVGQVLQWMGQIAEVLDHLHAQTPAIVHGDVKPSNVILTAGPSRQAILVDFGISQRREPPGDADAQPGEHPVVGSPGYMAPEVLVGAAATPAADIFSLAATTFSLLVGHPPRLGEPPDWAVIAAAARVSVERVFRAALAVDPARRPRSARAFVASLRSAAGSSHPARQPAAGLPAVIAVPVAGGEVAGGEPAPVASGGPLTG